MTQLELLAQPTYPRATQRQLWDLLTALEHGERLTVMVALQKYGVFALSQRCGDLRALGWPIQSKMIETDTGKFVKEYWI